MNEDQLRSNFDALVAEVRRLRESIAAHRAEVLEDLDLQSEENALPADSRLWDVL